MPKIDLNAIQQTNATGYPPPYDRDVAGRWYRRIAPAAGLTDFGVSHVTLKPGAWSSQRHAHAGEDEVLVMIAGHATLVDDAGRTPLRAGEMAAFPKGDGNAHHLVNESGEDCVFVVVGRPSVTECRYPDIDMFLPAGGRYVRKDGRSFG